MTEILQEGICQVRSEWKRTPGEATAVLMGLEVCWSLGAQGRGQTHCWRLGLEGIWKAPREKATLVVCP